MSRRLLALLTLFFAKKQNRHFVMFCSVLRHRTSVHMESNALVGRQQGVKQQQNWMFNPAGGTHEAVNKHQRPPETELQ